MENFGLGGLFYEGDNRNFTTSLGVTSRIKHYVNIELAAGRLGAQRVTSDPSRNAIFGWDQDYSDEDLQPHASVGGQVDPYRPDGDQHAQVFLSYRGQNFAMPAVDTEKGRNLYKGAVPNLDVTNSVSLRIDRDAKRIAATCRMVGDGFPNSESFLLDSGGADLFQAVHRRIGSATGQLHGDRRIAMASTSCELDFPGDKFGSALTAHWALDYATHGGGPIDLIEQHGGKPGDRPGWNRMHASHDAKGGRVRQWWLDNDVVWVPGRSGSSMP
jgi:hypothetical protein